MKVLGIDPGLDRTGWAILIKEGVNQPVLVASGLIHTPSRQALEERLVTVYDELIKIIAAYNPDEVAIEEMFFTKHTDTQSNTVHARGVILLACAKNNLKITGYNPKTIKKTVSGNGTALKPQMQRIVQLCLHLNAVPQPDDVADAMAAAICHIRLDPYNKLVKITKRAMGAQKC